MQPVRIVKINEEYFVEYHAQGLLFRKIAGETLEQAQTLQASIAATLPEDIKELYEVHDVSFNDFCKRFSDYAGALHTEQSFVRYRSVVNSFKRYLTAADVLKEDKLREITPTVIEGYKQHLISQKASNINFSLVILSDIFQYAQKRGDINDNPTTHISYLKQEKKKTVAVMTQAQTEQLIIHADPLIKIIIQIILKTGLRIEEIEHLLWGDIDFKKKLMTVHTFLGDVYEQDVRLVPMQTDLIKIMENQRPKEVHPEDIIFKDLDSDQVKEEVDRLIQQCDIPKKLTFNSLRHSFAAQILQKGVSLVALSKILGLHDILQVMIYFPIVVEKAKWQPLSS